MGTKLKCTLENPAQTQTKTQNRKKKTPNCAQRPTQTQAWKGKKILHRLKLEKKNTKLVHDSELKPKLKKKEKKSPHIFWENPALKLNLKLKLKLK